MNVALPLGLTAQLYPWGQIAQSVYTRRYEGDQLALTTAFLKEGMNVVDAGANIGVYSILASKRVGATGRVWAFEPSSETYAYLLRNLALNAAEGVVANRLALCDRCRGQISLKRSPGRGDAERYVDLYPDHPSCGYDGEGNLGDSELVDTTDLDAYVETHAPNKRIDFLKIDVEGCESAVLQGAQTALKNNAGIVVLFECSWQGCQWAGKEMSEVFDFLRDLGFSLSCRDKKKRRWLSDMESLRNAGNVWACRDRKQLLLLEYDKGTITASGRDRERGMKPQRSGRWE